MIVQKCKWLSTRDNEFYFDHNENTITVNECQRKVFSTSFPGHDRHVGAPKQRKGGHVGAPTKSSGNLTLLLCKRFLLFSLKNMAVDHVSENQ